MEGNDFSFSPRARYIYAHTSIYLNKRALSRPRTDKRAQTNPYLAGAGRILPRNEKQEDENCSNSLSFQQTLLDTISTTTKKETSHNNMHACIRVSNIS